MTQIAGTRDATFVGSRLIPIEQFQLFNAWCLTDVSRAFKLFIGAFSPLNLNFSTPTATRTALVKGTGQDAEKGILVVRLTVTVENSIIRQRHEQGIATPD